MLSEGADHEDVSFLIHFYVCSFLVFPFFSFFFVLCNFLTINKI